jgi:hypothetical protein
MKSLQKFRIKFGCMLCYGTILFDKCISRATVIGEIERWHLIVDEVPPADVFFLMHLPVNHRFLTDAIKLMQPSADTSPI